METLFRRLLIVFAFAWPIPIIITFFTNIENILLFVLFSFAVSFLFSIAAGLATKDRKIPYSVSIVAWTVILTFRLFPYQYNTWVNWFMWPWIGSMVGYVIGQGSSKISMGLPSWRTRTLRMLTWKKMLVATLSVLALAGFVILYPHLGEIVIYLDEHPWLPTIVSIIVTSILTFIGRGYYDRKKGKS